MKYNIDIIKQKLQNEKNSLKEICNELNYPYTYISRILVKNGISSINRAHLMKLNEDFIRSIYNLYMEGYSVINISLMYGISTNTIYRGFNLLNLKYKRNPKRQNVNDDFFKKIDTEEKAYLLGFFAADGTINKRDNGMALLIQERDVEILNYYSKAFNVPFNYYKYPAKKATHQNRIKLIVYSQINKQNLLSLGFPHDKTHNMFVLPSKIMDKSLYKHFIRGYFDGDGSIILPTPKSRVTKFKITSSNKDFLVFCKKLFEKIGCYNIKIEYPKNNLAASLYIQNKPSIKLIYDYLYSECNYCLKRKYDKMKYVAQQGRNFLWKYRAKSVKGL